MSKEKNRNAIHLASNTPDKELTLPDGQYFFNGVITLEVKNGKPVPYGIIGCYHARDGEQYLVDTTGRSNAILSLFTDDIPNQIYRIMAKNLLSTDLEKDE